MDNYQITPEDVKQLSKHVTLDMFFAADDVFKTAYNSLADENIKPLIKMQDDMCDSYPNTYQEYNHYVCGKLLDIDK